MKYVNFAMQRLLLGAIRAYQLILSPIIGPACRFHPSCSCYAADAVRAHGAWRGGILAFGRLLRCHPWGGSGFDPVPPVNRLNDTYLNDKKGCELCK